MYYVKGLDLASLRDVCPLVVTEMANNTNCIVLSSFLLLSSHICHVRQIHSTGKCLYVLYIVCAVCWWLIKTQDASARKTFEKTFYSPYFCINLNYKVTVATVHPLHTYKIATEIINTS